MSSTFVCPHCQRPYPSDMNVLDIPCTPYHMRCVRCSYPTALNVLKDGLCEKCIKYLRRLAKRECEAYMGEAAVCKTV